MIECIKQFRSDLEIPGFTNANLLREREIERRRAGPADDSDAGVAECLWSRTQRGERAGVEPTLDGSLSIWQLWICDKIRPGDAVAAEVENGAAAERGRQWKAALDGVDSGYLPLSE